MLAPRRDGPQALRRVDGGGFDLWTVRVVPKPKLGFRASFLAPEAQAALRRVISESKAALVHFHHLAHLDLGLPALARGAGLGVVWTLHDYHLLCVRGQLVNRALDRCPGPSLTRCAACVAEHLNAPRALRSLAPRLSPDGAIAKLGRRLLAAAGPGAAGQSALQNRFAMAKSALDAAHRLLAPSRDLAERVMSLGWAPEVFVQDLPLVAPLRSHPAGEGPVRFLFVGSLIPTKGPDVLVRAFGRAVEGLRRDGVPEDRLPTLTLWGPRPPFDGAPGYADALLREVAATGRARYGGVFDDAARESVFADADVLVLPSIWEENSPLVVREAIAAGLRVVASAVGGVAELDPNARLTAPKDPIALSSALIAESALGRARRPTRGYSMDLHIAALLAHYEAALRSRGRG